MIKDKKEIAKRIFESLKKGDTNSTLNVISIELEKEKTDKLQFTKTPLLNAIGQELGKLLCNEEQKFEKLLQLWKQGKRDEKLIVISALGIISKKNYEETKKFILEILEDIPDWEICDQLALRVIVNLAVQNKDEIFNLMNRWLKSANKWIRRLAVATIPPYIRAMKTEAKFCLNFLTKIMKEEDKDVKKAAGWSLREISKKDPVSVFEFLKNHTKNGDKNTIWIIKAGMKKLPEEQQKQLITLIDN